MLSANPVLEQLGHFCPTWSFLPNLVTFAQLGPFAQLGHFCPAWSLLPNLVTHDLNACINEHNAFL